MAEGSPMQTQDIVNWLKFFVVAFVVIALARTWFEQYAFGTVRDYDSIALFSGIVAVAIATAQFVLAPKPIPVRAMRETPIAAAVPAMPAYSQPPALKKAAKKAKKRRSK